MPSGGVTVDLAAASGGNIETTVAGQDGNPLAHYPPLTAALTRPQARW